jgi:hypothetical protein
MLLNNFKMNPIYLNRHGNIFRLYLKIRLYDNK